MSEQPITQDQNRSALQLLRRVWPFLAPFRAQLACLAVVVLFSIPLNLITPLPLTLAVDSVIGDRPLPHVLQAWLPADVQSSTGSLLLFVCIEYVGIALCIHLQSLTVWLLSSYTGERLIYAFRHRLFEHMQRICAPTTRRMDRPILPIAFSMMPPVLMLSIDVAFAVVGLSRLRQQWSDLKTTETATVARAQEVLGASRLVKAFGREEHEQRRFLGHATNWVREHNTLARSEADSTSCSGCRSPSARPSRCSSGSVTRKPATCPWAICCS